MDLVEDQFFTDVAVFRCVKEFLGQFGISSDAEKKAKWNNLGPIEDDPPVGKPFTRWDTNVQRERRNVTRGNV